MNKEKKRKSIIEAYKKCEIQNKELEWRVKYEKNCSYPTYNPELLSVAIKQENEQRVKLVCEVGVNFAICEDFDVVDYVRFDKIESASVLKNKDASMQGNDIPTDGWSENIIF